MFKCALSTSIFVFSGLNLFLLVEGKPKANSQI